MNSLCVLIYSFIFLISLHHVAVLGLKLPFSFNKKALIDLRSDTVTRPTPEMRTAMFDAEVGDDVFGEDPTVIALEEKVSKMLKKDAGLFFPTGTMSNLAAIMSWCTNRGSEMILGDKSHMFLDEQGGAAQIAGVSPRPLPNMIDGTIDLDIIRRSIRTDNLHFPSSQLIAIENTHTACGGRVLPDDYLSDLKSFLSSKNHHLPIHLDGARLWNAAVARDKSMSELAEHVDSISICLSKGLGAPAGSLLVGSRALINKARRARKVLGGGMRQVGILAAAGLRAVDDYSLGILSHDHRRAKTLAKAINECEAFHINMENVDTNIILMAVKHYNHAWGEASGTSPAAEVCNMLKVRGVLALPFGSSIVRLVTHRDIQDDDISRTITACQEVSSILTESSSISSSSTTIINNPVANLIPSVDVGGGDHTDADFIQPILINVENSNSETFVLENSIAVDVDLVSTSSTLSVKPAMQSNETYYEEVVVHGMSVSDSGFVVLLRGLICDRILSIHVTPSDPMSDGLDQDLPETAEAVTLLQLLQGIDVEAHLPRDTLSTKFATEESSSSTSRKKQMFLKRVMIDHVTRTKVFSGRLCGTYRNPDDHEAILASLHSSGTSMTDPTNHNSPIQNITMTTSSYLLQEVGINNSNDMMIPSHLFINLPIDKEVEVESAFEAIALALRHDAVIEVQASLLHNQNISYSMNEIKSFYPKLLEASSKTSSMMNTIGSTPLNEKPNPIVELERLYRQLQEAVRQQNNLKIDELKREINNYRRIGSDPDSFLLAPMQAIASSSPSTSTVEATVISSSDPTRSMTDSRSVTDDPIHPDLVDDMN